MAFYVDSGKIEGADVAGTLVAVVGVLPKYLLDGNWRVGLLVDEAASDEQAAKLEAVFSGELGGPMAVLAGLTTEKFGVQRVPMQFSSEGGSHVLTVGNQGRVAIRDLVPLGAENEPPARLVGKFHPVTVAGLSDGEVIFGKAETGSDLAAFGRHWRGKAAFSGHFSWAG